ncbi:MAG: S41 family peptidase [Chitinophagales bacterium]|nr:S41 family peptidase [Chitinophagales bacterium]
MNGKFSIWLPVIMAIILIAGIQIGLLLSSHQEMALTPNKRTGELNEVLSYVQAKYVDTINVSNLEDGAIDKVLENLDPHSTFIPASELKDVNSELEGNFEGIGIEFYIVNDTIMVVSTVSGGPAESSGIFSGDKIIKINDTTFAGKKVQDLDVIHHLRGSKGSKVTIAVLRKGNKSLMDFTITRDKIPMYSIDASYMIDDKTGFIKINRFSETTYNEFISAIKKLKQQGMSSLVIDLRQNGGGLLNAATDIIDELLDQQKLMVYTKGRVYSRTDYKTRVLGQFEEGALAILVDEGSASASEIVTGAVQDWDRGVVVGRRSFGKGLVQEQYALSDGSALRLTVAHYYTPSGRCIQKPYNHDLDAYYNEVRDRFHNGELSNKDSIHLNDTMKYYTSKGRVVYGGGGITPDIFVPLDTTNNSNHFLNKAFSQGLIQQFSYDYYQNHPSLLSSYSSLTQFRKNFSVDDNIYGAFLAFAGKNNISSTAMEQASAQPYITIRIKAFLAREKFNADAFYAVINDSDPVLQKAVEAINQSILP